LEKAGISRNLSANFKNSKFIIRHSCLEDDNSRDFIRNKEESKTKNNYFTYSNRHETQNKTIKHHGCAEMNLERMEKGDLTCSYPLESRWLIARRQSSIVVYFSNSQNLHAMVILPAANITVSN